MDFLNLVRVGTVADLRAALTPALATVADSEGTTPLMIAEGVSRVVLLIAAGAHVNARNRYGLTPLKCAVQGPDKGMEVVELLLAAGADPNLSNPLVSAEAMYIPLLVAYGADVNQANRAGETRLMQAVWRLDFFTAAYLLVNGADPDRVTIDGRTARSELHANDMAVGPQVQQDIGHMLDMLTDHAHHPTRISVQRRQLPTEK